MNIKGRIDRTSAFAVALILSSVAFIGLVSFDDTTGAGTGTEDDPYIINLAPGHQYTYQVTYTSGYTEVVTTASPMTTSIGLSVSVDDSTETVTFVAASDATEGQSQVFTITGTSSETGSEQVTNQYIKVNVVSKLSITSNADSEYVAGPITITPTLDGGMAGTYTWSSENLPAGLSIDADTGVITGTVEATNLCSFTIKASYSKTDGSPYPDESAQRLVEFKVYKKISAGNDNGESYNLANADASRFVSAVDNDGLTVIWADTSNVLASNGFTLGDEGQITGTYNGTTAQTLTVTLKVTSTEMSQVATKTIYLNVEPTFDIVFDPTSLTTYEGAANKTVSLSASESVSTIQWTLGGTYTGVSISGSEITVTGDVTDGQVITVNATTAYGQYVSADYTINKESAFAGTTDYTLKALVGGSNSISLETSGLDITWTVGETSGLILAINDDVLTLTGGSDAVAETSVTITGTTAGGQEITVTVKCSVLGQLEFTSSPTNGAIITVTA